MAYSNVGTPVFYIDNHLYRKSIGADVDQVENENLYNMSPIFPKNISTPVSVPVVNNMEGYNFTGNMKYYIALLNHVVENDFTIKQENGVDYTSDFTEVLNGGEAGASFLPFNGSTILTSTNTYTEGLQLDTGASIGAISSGIQYTMPHSPDLSLTMDIEMDGIKTITTAGGSSISNIQYTGNPLWVNGENKTNPFDVYSGNLDVTSTGARRNGRKSWSLKFSYISDSICSHLTPKLVVIQSILLILLIMMEIYLQDHKTLKTDLHTI